MRIPVLCLARVLFVVASPALYAGCERNDANKSDPQQTATSKHQQVVPESCDFGNVNDAARPAHTAAILLDQSGSNEASIDARCNEVGVEVAGLLKTLRNKFDLYLLVAATGKRTSPQIILDLTRVPTRIDLDVDDPLTSIEVIERKEEALWQQHVARVSQCVISRCRATTTSNSNILDLTQSAIEQARAVCKANASNCQKVLVSIHSDLADPEAFASGAKARVKKLTSGFNNLEVVACGTHQVKSATPNQQRHFANAWKRLFEDNIQILPMCPGSQLATTGRST